MASIVPVDMKAPLNPAWVDRLGNPSTVESAAWNSNDPDVVLEIAADTQTAVAVPVDNPTGLPKTVQVTAIGDPHFGDGTGAGAITLMAELTLVAAEAVGGALNVGSLIPK